MWRGQFDVRRQGRTFELSTTCAKWADTDPNRSSCDRSFGVWHRIYTLTNHTGHIGYLSKKHEASRISNDLPHLAFYLRSVCQLISLYTCTLVWPLFSSLELVTRHHRSALPSLLDTEPIGISHGEPSRLQRTPLLFYSLYCPASACPKCPQRNPCPLSQGPHADLPYIYT